MFLMSIIRSHYHQRMPIMTSYRHKDGLCIETTPCVSWAFNIRSQCRQLVPIMTSYLYKDSLCFETAPCDSWAFKIRSQYRQLNKDGLCFETPPMNLMSIHLHESVPPADAYHGVLSLQRRSFFWNIPHVSHEHPSSWVSTTSWCLSWPNRWVYTLVYHTRGQVRWYFTSMLDTLTHWGLVTAHVNISSGNGSLPGGNKPLPEPMLTYHQWGLVIWGQFIKIYHTHQSTKLAWKHFIRISQMPMS